MLLPTIAALPRPGQARVSRVLVAGLALGLAGCSYFTRSAKVGTDPSNGEGAVVAARAIPEPPAKPAPEPVERIEPSKPEPAPEKAPAPEKPPAPPTPESAAVAAPVPMSPPAEVDTPANDEPAAEPAADIEPPRKLNPPPPAALAEPPALPGPRLALAASDQSAFFNKELKLLFRIVACAGDEPVPAELAAVVAKHCRSFEPTIEGYKKKYLPQAQPFLVSLQPEGLPRTIVYPFGGGDLLSALTTYPNLEEVTTVSLEHAGDPRNIIGVKPKDLDNALEKVRRRVSGLLIWTESTSENMIQLQRGGIPGQLAFFLVGLAVHDQEPVSLRFFDVDPDGGVVGITAAAIEKRKDSQAQKLNKWWKSPDFSDAFSNSEITFRKAGEPHAPLRVHRHIAADISNEGLRNVPGVLAHLQAKGRVTVMTKAASYLLWSDPFTDIRNYLLTNMEFMLSDSTGISPRVAKSVGFEVLAYGRYDGPFLPAPSVGARDMAILFASQPERELKFRYGYPDNASHDHLVMMRRSEKQQASN